MPDDWKPGDHALCIADGGWMMLVHLGPYEVPIPSGGPRKGDRYVVACVHPSQHPLTGRPELYLGLHKTFVDNHYDASCFRKLPPSSEEHIRKLKEPFNIEVKEPQNV